LPTKSEERKRKRLAPFHHNLLTSLDLAVQGRSSLRLSLEASQKVDVLGHLVGQEFQSYEAVELDVLGLANHTHAATSQLFDDVVVGDGLPEE
jgi:hypothetical protein